MPLVSPGMFNLEKEIKKWKISLQRHEVFEEGLIADIETHLRDSLEALRKAGWDEEAAFKEAMARVGTAESIAAEYNKNRLVKLNRRSPLCPGRFMPALAWKYVKTALRTVRRQKGYSFINITGLALFVLLIACVNFVNLTTARSAKWTREVGMRKVVGARRAQLIRQFLSPAWGFSVWLPFWPSRRPRR